jgi:hypothetical protein
MVIFSYPVDFSKAWRVVKDGIQDGWNPRMEVGCCGILVGQAQEQSWNYCPFCGEKIPNSIIATYDDHYGRM